MGGKEDFGVLCLGLLSREEALSRAETRHLTIHFKTEVQVEHDELTVTCAKDSSKHLRSLEILCDIEKQTIEFPPAMYS